MNVHNNRFQDKEETTTEKQPETTESSGGDGDKSNDGAKKEEEKAKIIQKTEKLKEAGLQNTLTSNEKQAIEDLQETLQVNPDDPSKYIIEMQYKLIGELDKKELKLKKMKELINTMNKIVFINENMDSDLKNVQFIKQELTKTSNKYNAFNRSLENIKNRLNKSSDNYQKINKKIENMDEVNIQLKETVGKAE